MTPEEKIEYALFEKVKAMGAALTLPLAWPNLPFNLATQAPDGLYADVQHSPDPNTRIFLDGDDPHFRTGYLQVMVIGQRNIGGDDARAMAGLVAEYFKADTDMYHDGMKVSVSRAPDVAPAIPSNASWDVPVTIYYEAFG